MKQKYARLAREELENNEKDKEDAMKIYIKCKNIAPLRNLDETIDNKSFNLGILARNGSGKTFISRLFRLLEMHSITDISTINRLITIDQSNAQFIFGVSEKTGE